MKCFDANTHEIAADYQRDVAAALPPGVNPSEEFWRELAAAVAGYLTLSRNRKRRPPKHELERWRKITALINELGKELRDTRLAKLGETALQPIRDLAEAHVAGYQSINAGFHGRDPHRQFLYGAVLDLWCRHLGQKLGYTKDGPPVRFFTACVSPILGDDTPTTHGIATIVNREKARRRAYIINREKARRRRADAAV